MKEAAEGEAIEVRPHETFGIWRRGLEGSGFITRFELPAGVKHLKSHREKLGSFGGMPQVLEHFECEWPGTYKISFLTGRPWQNTETETVVTVRCS